MYAFWSSLGLIKQILLVVSVLTTIRFSIHILTTILHESNSLHLTHHFGDTSVEKHWLFTQNHLTAIISIVGWGGLYLLEIVSPTIVAISS